MNQEQISIDGLRDVARQLPNESLAAIREAALEHFNRYGLPTTRHEDWKYTDLSSAIAISNRWLQAGASQPTPGDLRDEIDAVTAAIDATWLVVANGVILTQDVDAASIPALTVSRISENLAEPALDKPLADLNTALLRDGLNIRIDGALDRPLGILVIDATKDEVGVTQSRVQIDVAPGATADIIEYHLSTGTEDHYANSVLTLDVGAAASVGYVRLQNRQPGHVQTGRTSIKLRKDAALSMASFDLGGRLVRNDLDIDLCEPGAKVSFVGLYLAGDDQHIDNHTRVDHRAGHATSSQEYRGILNGHCRCVWNGKAIVHAGADGTDATQANHNLLLSKKAEIDAKPELEIYADDVKCSHGTTVGQLDETALFYLRTRGLDKQHATRVLTHAFAAGLVSQVPVAAIRDVVARAVEERLAVLVAADIDAGLPR